MAERVDINMCQQAVSILANLGSSAETIIRQAVNACESSIYEGGFKARKADNRPAWITLAEDNGWIIEKNKIFGQIRLLSPTLKREVSINFNYKIQQFLYNLIRIGREEININDYFSNMALDKDGEFIVLVGRMGAKHIYSISLDNKNSNNDFNVAVNSGDNSTIGSFSVNANTHFKGDLKKFKKYEVFFEDNTANFSIDLLKNSKWFKNDPEMNSLFTTLKERKIKKWEYKSSFSESTNIDFFAEARNIGVDEVKLKSALEKRKGFYREFIVEF